MPAESGIQKYQVVTNHWTPAFAGVTTFYEFIKNKLSGESRCTG